MFIVSEWFVLVVVDDGGMLGMVLCVVGVDKVCIDVVIDKICGGESV